MFTCVIRAHVQQWHMCAFQFQTGSIRSSHQTAYSVIDLDKFQFQTGSIRSYACFYLSMVKRCFNSKLVRLEAEDKPYYSAYHIEFQFQTGSIRSIVGQAQLTIILIIVSIPNWFD